MKPRVAIVCSGLGHVRRGNETWASEVAQALHEAGSDVTLLGGGPAVNVNCKYLRVPNLRRDFPVTRPFLSWHRRYLWEQLTFDLFLRAHLRRDTFDIVHVTDPALAWRLQRREVETRSRVVYKDGLLLGPPWCQRFDFVQVLAPYYREQAAAEGVSVENWFLIPHLADTRRFVPLTERAPLRAKILGAGVPADAFVVMAAGDFAAESNKRLDWVLDEFTRLNDPQAHLIIVGQSTPKDLQRFGDRAKPFGSRVHLFTNAPAAQMIELYQTADVFVHAALREPFGIVFLEAMACGLPVVAHTFEVTRWIIGDGGYVVDMSAPGQMQTVLARWRTNRADREAFSRRARQRVEEVFSPAKVIPLYQALHEHIVRG